MAINVLRAKLHTMQFTYDTNEYPFKEEIESFYGVDLERLHHSLGRFDIFDRSKDQSTLAHKVFYANFNTRIKPLYDLFMREVISPIIGEKLYYQAIPTFRLGLPGNKFVGEFHKDSDYNHQMYEINFNLGLSNYLGEAALKTEVKPGIQEYVTLECPYGKIFSFDHIDCMHGSELNNSDLTMASIDFRIALEKLYFETDTASINMHSRFKPGEYFSHNLI